METETFLDAIGMARWFRGTHLPGLRCHSDAGSQFVKGSASPRFLLPPPQRTVLATPWRKHSTALSRLNSSGDKTTRDP